MTTTSDPRSRTDEGGRSAPFHSARPEDFLLHAPDLIFDLDEDGVVGYVSPNVREILGYDAAALTGERVSRIVHPDDRASLGMGEIAAHASRGALRRRVLHADGHTIWFEARINTYRTPEGELRGTVIGRPIDDRTAEERELDTMRAMVDSLPAPVLVINQDRRVFVTNTAWREQRGEGVRRAEGRPYAELAAERTDAETAARLVSLVEEAFDGRTPEPVVLRWDDSAAPGWWQVSARLARGRFVTVTHEDVTALAEAERQQRAQSEALRESDENQRQALRVARASIWRWDRQTREIWNSPALYEMLGYPPETDAQTLHRHADDAAAVREQINEAIRQRLPYAIRYRVARADGTWLWAEERGEPTFNAQGELTGYTGTTQDIDEHVRREEALRESDERQRKALGVARATIWEWDYQTKQLWRSPDLYAAIGYDVHQIPADFDDRVALRHPDDAAHTRREAESAIRARRPFVVRYRMAVPGGGWNWVEQRGEPRYSDTGEYLGFRGTTQDIDALVRREEAVRESDERRREALHIARAASWDWDARTRQLRRSPEFAALLGFEAVSDDEAERLVLRHPDDTATSQRATELAIRARLPYSVRYRLRTADGAWKWMEQRGAPKYDADGRYTGYQGTVQDIDEQVAREQALREGERLQREALEIARASRWRWDTETGAIEESSDLFRRLGYDAPPSDYEEHMALRHPDDRERSRRESRAAIEARRAYTVRYRLARKDGGYVWLESRGVPEFDAEGNLVCYHGTCQDIDEQVRREEALRESDDRQREALSIARASTWTLDLATGNLLQSPELYRALGHEGAPVTRDEMREITDPADRQVEQAMVAAVRARQPYTIRYRMARADGSWAWVETRGVPVLDGRGEVIAYRGTRQDIDDQVRREEALRESDERQREALRVARASSWVWDRATGGLTQSPELYEWFGYDRVPASNEEMVALRHPDDRAWTGAEANAAVKARRPYTMRYRMARADGSWAWVEARGVPVFDEHGHLQAYRGTRQDIDEQVRREEALRESDDRQREALRIARASTWIWDRATRVLTESVELYQLLGYDAVPSDSDERAALRHPDDPDVRIEAADAIRRREPYVMRYRLRRAGGGWVWVEARGTPVFDASGELVGYRGTTQDVDEQVRREEALRESDDRQREAFRIARASLWVWDRATRELTQSDDLYRLLGYDAVPADFEGRVALRHPDDQAASREAGEDAIRRRVPYVIRYRLRRAGGGWVWIEERGTPIFDAAGTLTGYRGTTQDVDDQVSREEALRESDDRQREALRIARASTWTWDRRTREVHQTNDLYRALGYHSNIQGWEARLVIRHPDDREPSRLHAEGAIQRREPYVMRYRLARADGGGWVWIEERGTPVFDAAGTLTGYRGTTQDVDEQVRREEDLHEALRMARAGFWYRGKGDSAPWWSPEIYDMIGLDRSTVPTNDAWVRHPDDLEWVAVTIRQAMSAAAPYTIRYRALHLTAGNWIWVELHGSPVYGADGTVIGYRGVTRDITEEVAREAELRRSEAMLGEAQRLSHVGSWSTDATTGKQYWSEQMYSLLGYTPGEVEPSREAIIARVHPDNRDRFSVLSEHSRQGKRVTGAFRAVLPDGRIRWFTGSVEPQVDTEGHLTELLGVIQDVTDQVEAETRLRQSEERLQAVVDSVGDGITLLSRDGKGDWANDAFFRMVGYTREELESVGPAILFDRSTVRDVARWLRGPGSTADSASAALPLTYSMRLHRRDGTVLTAEATPSILRDGDEVVGLLSVIRDTTERDRLQGQVDAAALEIEQILQTAALPIIVIREDGTIHLANRRTIEAFGWTPEELAGQDVSILAAGLNPTTHREHIRRYDAGASEGTPSPAMLGRTLEVVAKRRDGSEFPVEVSVTEMSGPTGDRRFLGVIMDLTERKRTEEEITRMQKAEALGTLVAGVAHDFNNLLTAMVGGIAMAKSQPGQDRWLDLAGEAADRATRLVQQLLQFSRRSRPELQEIDPASLVERTTALVRETFDRRIAVSLELPTVWGVIAGDEGQLQQVVMNLLVNARDAVLERAEHEHEGYQPSIHVALSEDLLRGRPAVRVDVRDNGAGMTAAVRARAFDPFFTTKPVGQGTGLGLATVAGIIERHEGDISIESAPGAGTTFSVRLPLVTSGLPDAPGRPGEADGPAPADMRTVMVVDDEEMVRFITAGYLEDAGYRVVQMGGGQAAIDAIEGGAEADIILTDVNMPSPNGWELLARLRDRPGIPPIVVASGYADAETARERGAAGFLHKPFSQAALVQALEEILRRG